MPLLRGRAALIAKRKRARRIVVESQTESEGTYQRELVRCGKCRRCKRAPAHGPYWYLYQWLPARGSKPARQRSTYIGKELARRIG